MTHEEGDGFITKGISCILTAFIMLVVLILVASWLFVYLSK